MKKRVIALLLTAALSGQMAWAMSDNVEVALPNFGIKINEMKIENSKQEFPFINYNGVTYVPMTWEFANAMGLSTQWSSENGLQIEKADEMTSSILANIALNDMNIGYEAQIADFPISINGNTIDNANEEYPILTFRGVSYVPLTWKYVYEEFGGESTWSAETGLSINVERETFLDVDAIHFDESKPFIEITPDEKHGQKIKWIDTSYLTEELQTSTYSRSTNGGDSWFTLLSDEEIMQMMVINKYEKEEIKRSNWFMPMIEREDGYHKVDAYDMGTYEYLFLYDKDLEPTHYAVIPNESSKEAYRLNLKPVEFEYKAYEEVLNKTIDDQLKTIKMIDETLIEKKQDENGDTYLFVDRSKLPANVKEFTQIGLSSKSSDDLEATLIHSIASNMALNKSFARLAEPYDEEIGRICYSKRYVGVYLMDDDYKLLGYTIIK